MSNNPSLSVEFKAINESPVIQSIDRVSSAGKRYIDEWTERNRSSSSEYVRFWKQALAYQDRQIQDHFREAQRQRAMDVADAKMKAREAANAVVAEKKAETARLIAEGRKILEAQRTGPSKDLYLANQARVANEKATLDLMLAARDNHERNVKQRNDSALRSQRTYEAEQIELKKQSVAKEIELGKAELTAAKNRRAQLNLENRVVNAGGYGPKMPTAPTVAPDRAASVINAGMVNAAAFLTVATQAYAMASRAVGVISGFVMDAAKWEAMDMGLRNMEGSARGAADATEKLYEIAKAPGIELATATKAYLQLRSLHMAGSDAERTIKAISNTIARGGGGSVEFERVLRQLTQMLSKGKVLEQDLRIMKEAMPELASLMQKAFGETTAEGIRKSGVNAKLFVETMLTGMEKLPKAQQTLTSEIENSQVAWSRLKAAFVDTEWTKKFLQNVTRAFEAARIAMRGTEEERKRADYESSIRQKAISGAKFRAGPIGYALGKFGIANYDTEYNMSEADIQQMMDNYDAGKRVERIKAEQNKVHDRFKRERLDKTKKFSGKVDGMTEEEWIATTSKGTAAFAPNSEGVATGKTSADGDKKKYDPIAADQERLRQMLRSQAEETAIRDKYNDTVAKLTQEGIDESEAKAVADRNKAVDEVRRKFNDMRKLAHGNAALEKQITDESERQQYETFVLWNDKLIALREENEKKKLEQKRKYQEEEDKANKAHQDRVDAWNQKQIDKNREDNQKRNAYAAKSNKYTQIDYDFKVENDLILELFKKNEEEMTRQLEINLAKRNQMRREAESNDYVQGLNGATQLSNSLAENIKASIDYSYNAKREAIEKEYALAERAGTATEAMRKAKDDKLAELDSQRAKRMKGSYATMFRIVKTFEIATASVQLAAAALNALNDKTAVTIGQKLANVGLVMAAGANLVSQITSATYSGYFDRGGNIRAGQWGIAGENGPEIIQGPAHVTSTRDTARLMGSGSGGNITVNNYAGATVSTSKNANGDWEIMIQRAAEAAEDRISAGIASGGGKVSQQLTRTFGVKR